MSSNRQTAPLNRRVYNAFCFVALMIVALDGCGLAQGTAMGEPDDTKPVEITGCMTARTKSGGFILSGVFGRPVTVIGPNYLQTGLGHQVTLTGSWQSSGIAPKDRKVEETRMFIASSVKITARQCAVPPSSPPASTDADKHPGK